MKFQRTYGAIAALFCTTLTHGADFQLHQFTKQVLTQDFYAEGCHFGDFNRDGHRDIAAGPFWFEGPKFEQRHEYTAPPEKPYQPATGYSDYFLMDVYDFNKDGWDDILVFGWPGKESAWYQNPKNETGHWTRHVAFGVTDNESPALADLTGDGKPEILCMTEGHVGFAEANWEHPEKPWQYHKVSEQPDAQKYFRYTHGYGHGDINGDGRVDIVEKFGWWEQPENYRQAGPWKFHPHLFTLEGLRGGAQMLVYDVNGDGRNDVVTSLDAHGYGLAWYEQVQKDGAIDFERHLIVNIEPEENRYGVQFTQIHSMDLADMDNDGLMDVVTGKRFWAHGPTQDADPNAPAVLYWFKLVREPGETYFVPHRIDNDSGVGTQVTVGDLNQDQWPDVIVANKKGIFVFLHQVQSVTRAEWEAAQPKPL